MALAFVGIPFYSLARYRAMGEAVRSLRTAGIVGRLRSADPDLADLGDVCYPQIEQDHGPENLQNFEEFLQGTRNLKSKLSQEIKRSTVFFCLGGDCTLVVGTLAGLKASNKGRPGMVWLDAHGDFNTPETSPSGFIGGMPLALSCGRGPKLSDDVEALRPLLEEERVFHVGSRSLDPGEDEALQNSVKLFAAKDVKKQGTREVARQVAKQLSDSSDWIIAHLDVDVLDPLIMPGVNYPEPGGLTTQDIQEIFHQLQSTGKLKAVDLTAYNPALDVDKQGQSVLLDLAPSLVRRP